MGLCWSIFRIFFAFWGLFGRILRHPGVLGRFFSIFLIFCQFWMDFGKILAWFFDGFAHVCPKSRFCKNRCFSIGKLLFSRIRACKNPAKIHANFVWENKIQKNAQEMHLGRAWAPFGKGLGRSGASFGRSWALLGHFGGVQNRAVVKH